MKVVRSARTVCNSRAYFETLVAGVEPQVRGSNCRKHPPWKTETETLESSKLINEAMYLYFHEQTSSLDKGPWQASGTLWRQDAVLQNPPPSLWDATWARKLNACARLKVSSAEEDCDTTKTPTHPPTHLENLHDSTPPLRRGDRHSKCKRRMGKPLGVHQPLGAPDQQQKSPLESRVVTSFLLSLVSFFSLSLTWFIGT